MKKKSDILLVSPCAEMVVENHGVTFSQRDFYEDHEISFTWEEWHKIQRFVDGWNREHKQVKAL